MASERRLWTREELIVAFSLYCELPFGQLNSTNPKIIRLAELIDRTSSAVAWKLNNFASLDPVHQKRGIKGAYHTSKQDKIIWDEFHNDWDNLTFESAQIKAKFLGQTLDEISREYEEPLDAFYPAEGTEKERKVHARVNQHFFRKTVLSAYDYSCCITGLNISKLLIASHIVPWSKDKENRLNPRNGLCLNAFHDKAFDTGLLTVTPDFKVQISESVKVSENGAVGDLLLKFNNQKINLPHRFHPDSEFLKYHNDHIFRH
jgi:putative restriction endonuclease